MSAKFTEKDLERATVFVEGKSDGWHCPPDTSIAQLIADVRAEQAERDALLCIGRCKNKATGAVLAGLIRSDAPITAAEDES